MANGRETQGCRRGVPDWPGTTLSAVKGRREGVWGLTSGGSSRREEEEIWLRS
jgi:hypothetical protein